MSSTHIRKEDLQLIVCAEWVYSSVRHTFSLYFASLSLPLSLSHFLPCSLTSSLLSPLVGYYGAVSAVDINNDGTRLLCGYAKGLVGVSGELWEGGVEREGGGGRGAWHEGREGRIHLMVLTPCALLISSPPHPLTHHRSHTGICPVTNVFGSSMMPTPQDLVFSESG